MLQYVVALCFFLNMNYYLQQSFILISSFCAQIDNRRLTLDMENTALCVSQFVDGKWKSKEKSR